MAIDFQKVADAIEKSSPEIKNLMFSAELGDKIGIIAENNKLDEETAFKLFDEIGYIILDLKSKFSFFDSLVEIGIDKDIANSITKETEVSIFSKLDAVKNNSNKPTENNSQPLITDREEVPEQSEIKSTNNIGQSFEDIILNQARAMMPARPMDESGRVTSHESRDTNRIAENLPIKQDKPRAIHNYIGSDPYREPTE